MNGRANAPRAIRADASARNGRRWLVRLLSWLFVAIPAVWGVAQVAVKSLVLFR